MFSDSGMSRGPESDIGWVGELRPSKEIMATDNVSPSLLVVIFALILLSVGVACPFWLTNHQEDTAFRNLGLWTFCWSNYHVSGDVYGRVFDGCYNVFGQDLIPLRRRLLPDWFVATQALTCIALAFSIISTSIAIVAIFPFFRKSPKKWPIVVAVLMQLFSGLCICAVAIMFGIKAKQEWSWIEKPHSNSLYWAYGMVVTSSFFNFLGCFTLKRLHRAIHKYRKVGLHVQKPVGGSRRELTNLDHLKEQIL